jgi:hypothetical protein
MKRRRRVTERTDAKSSPAKVSKRSTTDFTKIRLRARDKLCVALTKVLVTDAVCGKVAQEIEQSIYSLHIENCGVEYKQKYKALARNIEFFDNLDLIRRLMARKLLPGKVCFYLLST